MNFKEEYKKSAESISPDREAINRMKSAVLAQIAAEPEKPAGIPEKKKQIPFKKIAYIGGAAAACAVVTVAAVTLLPMLSKTGNFVDESSSIAASMLETAADLGSDGVSGSADIIDEVLSDSTDQKLEMAHIQTTTAATNTVKSNISETEYDTEAGENFCPTTDNMVGSSYNYDAVQPDSVFTDEEKPVSGSQSTTIPGASKDSTAEAQDASISNNATDDRLNETSEAITEENVLATAISSETCEAAIEIEDNTCVIVLTGKDWITYNGIPYYLDSEIKAAVCPQEGISALNAADRKNYIISVEDETVFVFSESGEFLGAYKNR